MYFHTASHYYYTASFHFLHQRLILYITIVILSHQACSYQYLAQISFQNVSMFYDVDGHFTTDYRWWYKKHDFFTSLPYWRVSDVIFQHREHFLSINELLYNLAPHIHAPRPMIIYLSCLFFTTLCILSSRREQHWVYIYRLRSKLNSIAFIAYTSHFIFILVALS